MAEVSAAVVLEQLARALPETQKHHVIVVGSLAAAYQFFGVESDQVLTTKDLDCMFTPHAKAVVSAREVTEQLLADNWTFRPWGDKFAAPGGPSVPTSALPVVRLLPPKGVGSSDWFLELLGAPAGIPSSDESTWKTFDRIETPHGAFGLPSFGFLGFAQWSAIETQHG